MRLTNKKYFSILTTGFLVATILGAGYAPTSEDSTMASASEEAATEAKTPPMDETVPATTDTATFALG